MSDEKKFYCFCGSNCKYETMTKEQILAAIAQATGVTEVDPNAGFISKVLEKNSGRYVTLWVGTQAEYNALPQEELNCLYIITDDTTKEEFSNATAAATSAANEATAAAANAEQQAKNAWNYTTARWGEVDEKLTPSYFTRNMALSYIANSGGEKLTSLSVTPQKYVFMPSLGVVFFSFFVAFAGAMNDGESFEVAHIGSHYPVNEDPTRIPIAATPNSLLEAEYIPMSSSAKMPIIRISAKQTFDTKGIPFGSVFSGWYFCDGE